MLNRLRTRIVATFAMSGTLSSRSSPDSAGTGAPVAGSTFIAIVPPVAIIWQIGGGGERGGGGCWAEVWLGARRMQVARPRGEICLMES